MSTSILLAALALAALQEQQTSGRPVPPEQACYDVLHYDLRLRVDPEERAIEGSLTMRARVLEPSKAVILDLDDSLEVHRVLAWREGHPSDLHGGTHGQVVPFEHEGGEIRVRTARFFQEVGSIFEVTVEYGGKPREAPRPPWDGGFVWAETSDGAPWIATACQSSGADLWWPCKDQPDDEADTMDLWITVPKPLVCAANGRLLGVEEWTEGWSTYVWRVSTPINNYGVALNIAPYRTIEREYESVAGETFPITYWVLPENVEQGEVLMDDVLRQMRFFEETFGPYPFRADKYGIAETPYLGMEHQTIIAYGNEYRGNPWGKQWGFDMLHLHEFAHEWWANLVTCANWNDMWIHEGFATYAQALYVEELHGREAYHEEIGLAGREPGSSQDFGAPVGVVQDHPANSTVDGIHNGQRENPSIRLIEQPREA